MASGFVTGGGRAKVKVRFFSSLRDLAGVSELVREVAEGTTVGEFVASLLDERPRLAAARERMYIALNHRFAAPETRLADGDELALFPPVSGGAPPSHRKPFAIVTEPLSADEVAARVATPEVGAITTFIGTVRNHTGDRLVDHLEYEAYAEMAEPLLERIGEEIKTRWPSIRSVAIVHRVGRLEIGEASIVIAVAASHRQDTFDACAYAIERVKAIVPIWKKEVWASGEEWIEGPRQPDPLLAQAWATSDPSPREDSP